MADTITKTFLSLAGLTHYDEKIKAVISSGDVLVMNKVSEAQAEIDNLEKLVGKLPEGTTAADVVAYVDLKTQGVASEEVLTQLQETVTAIDAAVKAIQADYLKASDKQELSDAITAETDRAKAEEKKNADAIAAEKERAEGIESGLRTDVDAIKGDYLKASDKTELSDAINAEKERAMVAEKVNSDAIAVLNGEGEGSVAKTVDDAINKFATDVTNDNVVNSYKELIDWAAEHGAEAAEMVAAIEGNEQAISDLAKLVGELPEGETSADVIAYIQKLVNAEQTRAEGVEGGHATRIEALETAVGTSGGKSVAEQITEAVDGVQSEVDALEEVVGTKASQADLEAAEGEIDQLQTDVAAAQTQADKGVADAASALAAAQAASTHADELNAAMDTRVKAVEAASHTHANKDVLDGITATKVSAWDAAEGNAKTYADGLNTAMDTRMTAAEGKASANESAISDLSSTHATDKAALEASIKAVEDSLVEITTGEIDAMFSA